MSLFRIYQMYLELNLKTEIMKYKDKYWILIKSYCGFWFEDEMQDVDNPRWNKLCNEILEINVKIAYEMKKSDKLYILKENIKALFKDKENEFDNFCKER